MSYFSIFSGTLQILSQSQVLTDLLMDMPSSSDCIKVNRKYTFNDFFLVTNVVFSKSLPKMLGGHST